MESELKKRLTGAAGRLADNYRSQEIFEITIGEKIPSRTEIIAILEDTRRLMFPGIFGEENTAYVTLENFAGATLARVYERLFKQIKIALLYKGDACGDCEECENIDQKAETLALSFIDRLPELQALLMKDVQAEFEGDPAAIDLEEIIFAYPPIYAIFVYRVAHELYRMHIPYIPRIMSEYAHSESGIDIHPGAEIGEYFFIDHGTGIVIGETTKIGDRVKLYQGVTLGALSTAEGQALSGVKRHPTIEDGVVIYANATILGGRTVIGEGSVVAGNTFITRSVPAHTEVSVSRPELRIAGSEPEVDFGLGI